MLFWRYRESNVFLLANDQTRTFFKGQLTTMNVKWKTVTSHKRRIYCINIVANLSGGFQAPNLSLEFCYLSNCLRRFMIAPKHSILNWLETLNDENVLPNNDLGTKKPNSRTLSRSRYKNERPTKSFKTYLPEDENTF